MQGRLTIGQQSVWKQIPKHDNCSFVCYFGLCGDCVCGAISFLAAQFYPAFAQPAYLLAQFLGYLPIYLFVVYAYSAALAVLEEIAYNNGWIDKEHLLNSAKAYGKAPYGQYLQKVADGKIIKEY